MFATLKRWLSGPAPTRRAAPRPAARLGVESLEAREVPAAVTAYLSGGVLTVSGTEQADTIRVHRVNDRISVGGIKIAEAGKPVADVAASAVKKIVVSGRGGNDRIDLNSNSYTNSQLLTCPAVIDGGGGDDVIDGTAAGDTIESGLGYDQVFGRDGDDTINVRVGRDRVKGGAGNDTINAELAMDTLSVAKSGRLFWNDSFVAGNGTDTVNLRLNKEAFGTFFLKPVIRELKAATSVFNPVLNLLDRKVPALSQFKGGLTYSDMLKAASPKVGQFLDAVRTLRNLSSTVSLSGWADIGSFKVASGAVPAVSTSWFDPVQKINSSALDAARKAGVQFGLLKDARTVFDMLTGKNIELVSVRLELPKVQKSIEQHCTVMFIGPVEVGVDFGGKVWASAGATFGIDMSGVWKGRLMDGFFIKNATAAVGAEAWVAGGFTLGVSDKLSIGSIKGYGSVSGTLTFNLTGGKGHLYLADMPDYYSQAFKPSGQIGYDIGIKVKYAQLVWTKTWWGGYPEWIGKTHTESFGKGTFRL